MTATESKLITFTEEIQLNENSEGNSNYGFDLVMIN